MSIQRLTLTLEGITAGDYLAWVRDPEPPALGGDLREIEVWADPLGNTIEAVLTWRGDAPEPQEAAAIAGLSLTPEVVVVERCELALAA